MKAHPKQWLEISNKWRRENPGSSRRNASRWAKENPERVLATHRAWIEKNRDRTRLYATNRTRRLNGKITSDEMREIPFNNLCSYCGNTNASGLDHVVPITLGGTHTLDNVVPCCFICNASKNNRPLVVFLMSSRMTRLAA